MRTALVDSALLTISSILLGVYPGANRANACSCISQPPPKSFAETPSVFAGIPEWSTKTKAEAFGRTFDTTDYIFRVTHVWKGPAADTLIVRTWPSGGMCGYEFELGVHYLVYAHERDGDLWASVCSRTNRVELALWERYTFPPPRYRGTDPEFPKLNLIDLFSSLASDDWQVKHEAAIALAYTEEDRDSVLSGFVPALEYLRDFDPDRAIRATAESTLNRISSGSD